MLSHFLYIYPLPSHTWCMHAGYASCWFSSAQISFDTGWAALHGLKLCYDDWFGWDSFWGVMLQMNSSPLLTSIRWHASRWNTVYAGWTSVFFDRSLVRSKWNITRSPCCGFCFTLRFRWLETYAMMYAQILDDELALAFAVSCWTTNWVFVVCETLLHR
jgi:hypothetical protein